MLLPTTSGVRPFSVVRFYLSFDSCPSSSFLVPAYLPVPVSLITPGLSGALSLTVAAPVKEPATLGRKVTRKVQVAPAATVAPQGAVPEPVAVKPPLAAMLEMVRVVPELLVRVTDFGALDVPTA